MTTTVTTTTDIDIDAIGRHYDAIWAGHDWPDGFVLAINYRDEAVSRGMKTKRVAVGDRNRFCSTLADLAEQYGTWVNVAPQPAGTQGRGGAAASPLLPALYADIDVAGGIHKASENLKALPLPPEEVALEIMGRCPVRQTLITRTGGGFHFWTGLTAPLDTTDPLSVEIVQRWKAWWAAQFSELGFHFDAGISGDIARMLRVAGTLNHKIPKPPASPTDPVPVVFFVEPGDRVDSADIRDSLPPVPERPARKSRVNPKPRSSSTSSPDDDDDRPGTLLRQAVGVSELLEAVMGWEQVSIAPDGGARWRIDSGSDDHGDHAASYPPGETGYETVTVFCELAIEEYGLQENPTWDTWSLLIHLCSGDTHLAARIARQCPDADSLVALLTTHTTPEALAEAVPEVVVVPDLTTSIVQAIEAFNGTEISLGRGLCVQVGGGRDHGLLKEEMVTNPETGEKEFGYTPITDWLAWRPEVVTRLNVDHNCRPEVVGDEEYTVELVTSAGRRYRRSEFSAKSSTSARDVVDRLNAGVMLPLSQVGRWTVDNMLRVLGHAEQEPVSSFTSMGWCYAEDETPVYLAPNGSVTPSGVTDQWTVGPPLNSEKNGLNFTERRTGFSGADVPIEQAAQVIPAFCNIVPGRPEVAIALLGLLFSSPLRLGTRGVVVLAGRPGTGKTHLATAVQSFISDITMGAKDSTSLGIPASSEPGATNSMSWHRDALLIADDYRRDENDPAANAKADAVLKVLAQSGYGTVSGAKATQNGGTRGSKYQAASALITAETKASGTAILGRSIHLPISEEDNVLEKGGPIDTFKIVADSGAPRSLMAHYIQYLSQRAATRPGGLERMAATMAKRARRHYMEFDGARAAETVAALAVGWQTFREFAVEAGIEELLPTPAEVDRSLRIVVRSNAQTAAENDHGQKVVAEIGAMLAGQVGHLASHSGGGERPLIDGVGWVRSVTELDNGSRSTRWDAKGPLLGHLSCDGSVVVLVRAGIKAAMRSARMDGLQPDQVYSSIAQLCVPGTNPGTRCPVSLAIACRPEGYAVPSSLLGLGAPPEDDDPPPADTPTFAEDEVF